MTEQTSTAIAGEQNNEQQEQAKEFEAITSQEDFDKAIQARIARERAKYADYEELKAKAEKLTEIEAASLTEAEKTAQKLADAEKRAADLEVKATRAEVAAAKGIPAELLAGTTQAELEASADALIAFRGEQKQTPSSTALGRANTTPVATGPAAEFAALFGNN